MALPPDKRSGTISLLLAAALCLTPSAATLADAEPDGAEQMAFVRGLAAAWQQNRAAFTRFSCHYRLIKGKAATREDALGGKLTETYTAECVWAVDGDRVRCSLAVDDDAVPRTTTDTGNGTSLMTAPIASSHYVSNGPVDLYYGPVSRIATLWDTQWSQSNDLTTPFSMGIMGPGETATPAILIEKHIKGNQAFTVSQGTGIGGGEGVTIRLDSDSKEFFSYTFDAKHGFLTSQITWGLGNRTIMEVHVTEARQSADGFWFPMQSVKLIPRAGESFSVHRIEVTELDFSPEPEDFTFTLPEGTTLVNRSNAKTQHRLHEDVEVSPDTLKDVEARCLKAAQRRALGLPASQARAPQPTGTNWWLVLGASVVTAGAGWGLLRKFRGSSAA